MQGGEGLERHVHLIVAALFGLVVAGCGGTAPRPHAAVHKATPNVWHIGAFTVREVSLPPVATADGFPNYGPYALSGGFTLAAVSTSAPYTLTRTNLVTGAVTSLGTVPCAQQPYFAQTVGTGAALFCPGPVGSSANSLVLINRSGPMRSLSMPVQVPVPAGRLEVTVQEFDGYAEWFVALNSEPPTLYGRGMVDIATGKNEPIPASIENAPGTPNVKPGTAMGPGSPMSNVFIGPGDALYDAASTEGGSEQEVYRWSPSETWMKVGTVSPGPYPYGEPALAPDGSIWWTRPELTTGIPYKWHVVRTVMGSARTESWYIHGDVLGVGPGYYAYLPFDNSAELVVDFPMVRKRLTFPNLNVPPSPPYMMDGVAQMGTDWSVLTNTQVIYMGQGTKEKVLLITP